MKIGRCSPWTKAQQGRGSDIGCLRGSDIGCLTPCATRRKAGAGVAESEPCTAALTHRCAGTAHQCTGARPQAHPVPGRRLIQCPAARSSSAMPQAHPVPCRRLPAYRKPVSTSRPFPHTPNPGGIPWASPGPTLRQYPLPAACVAKQICLASYLAVSQLSQKYLRHQYNLPRFTSDGTYSLLSAIAVLAETLAN